MADNGTTPAKQSKNKITIKQRVILLVSCPLIVILLSSIAIVVTVRGLEASGELEETTAAPDVMLEASPDFTASPESYCADLLKQTAKADDVKVSSRTDVSVHDMSGDFSDDVFAILNNVMGQINDGAKGKYDSLFINYGESCESLGELADVSSLVLESSGEGKNDNISYTLTLPANAPGIAAFLKEDKNVYEECKADCAESVELTDDSFTPDVITAYYNYNVKNEQLVSFELVREYKVNANVRFLGGLEAFGSGAGSGTVSFGVRVSTKYDIVFAGISVQEELTLTKHGFQTLSLSANVADDALSDEDAADEGVTDPDKIFTVEFISSDESIATVDKTGMVEAVKVSDEPVTVTVRLNYHGKTYEDTCIVHVIEEED